LKTEMQISSFGLFINPTFIPERSFEVYFRNRQRPVRCFLGLCLFPDGAAPIATEILFSTARLALGSDIEKRLKWKAGIVRPKLFEYY
jgi:hypothetical protein